MEKSYAIIETGGKQYRVFPGQTVDVDRLEVAAGKPVELGRVLLINNDGQITAGNPVVRGARVMATSQGERKGKKVIVFKYKPKVRYRKKTGHRQLFTRLSIDRIVPPGAVEAEPVKKTARRRKKEAATDGA